MKGKFFILVFCTLYACCSLYAQSKDPVNWSFDLVDKGNNEYEVVSTAKIAAGWFIYSQNMDAGGPVPTSFAFDNEKSFELIGGTIQEDGEIKEEHDPLFEMLVKKYAEQAIFTATIKVIDGTKKLKGNVRFMSCDAEKCLPPKDIDFEFDL